MDQNSNVAVSISSFRLLFNGIRSRLSSSFPSSHVYAYTREIEKSRISLKRHYRPLLDAFISNCTIFLLQILDFGLARVASNGDYTTYVATR